MTKRTRRIVGLSTIAVLGFLCCDGSGIRAQTPDSGLILRQSIDQRVDGLQLQERFAMAEIFPPIELDSKYVGDPEKSKGLVVWLTGQGFKSIQTDKNNNLIYAKTKKKKKFGR
jgi:hypothetical protein